MQKLENTTILSTNKQIMKIKENLVLRDFFLFYIAFAFTIIRFPLVLLQVTKVITFCPLVS